MVTAGLRFTGFRSVVGVTVWQRRVLFLLCTRRIQPGPVRRFACRFCWSRRILPPDRCTDLRFTGFGGVVDVTVWQLRCWLGAVLTPQTDAAATQRQWRAEVAAPQGAAVIQIWISKTRGVTSTQCSKGRIVGRVVTRQEHVIYSKKSISRSGTPD